MIWNLKKHVPGDMAIDTAIDPVALYINHHQRYGIVVLLELLELLGYIVSIC